MWPMRSTAAMKSDVGARRTVVLIPGGNLTSQPTLDLCNGAFPSEQLRTARLQVASVDAAGNTALSTEAVANLIANLQKTGFFRTVEIKETYQDEAIKDMQAFQFTLTCEKGKS